MADEKVDSERFPFIITQLAAKLLFAITATLWLRVWWGDPIDCISNEDIPNNLLDNLCLQSGTFSVADAWHNRSRLPIVAPGVPMSTDYADKHLIYHYYYNLIVYLLLLHSMVTYLPSFVWRRCARRKIRSLLQLTAADGGGIDCEQFDRLRHMSIGVRLYITYIALQCVNCVILCAQFAAINYYLSGNFVTLGCRAFAAGARAVIDQVFASETNCVIYRSPMDTYATPYDAKQDHEVRPSTIVRTVARCSLTNNFLFGAVYLCLWYLLAALITLTIISLIYTAVNSSKIRRIKALFGDDDATLRAVLSASDYLLYELLARNANARHVQLLRVHLLLPKQRMTSYKC